MYLQGKTVEDADMIASAGTTPMQIFAFWFVTLAAISAWEAKLPIESVADQAKSKLAELGAVRAAVEGDTRLMGAAGIDLLAPFFALPNMMLATAAERDAARSKLNSMSLEPAEALALVRRIGCAYCQAQRHSFQAYNPMVAHASALYDTLLYGEPQPLLSRDINAPPREITSRMVKMAYDADPILKAANVEIPLFW